MKTLYFDCFSGASGNMILGGVMALGIKAADLKAEIEKLNIPEFDLVVTKVERSGISAVHVETEYQKESAHRHLSDIKKIILDSDLDNAIKKRSIAVFEKLAAAEAKVHGIAIEKVHFHEVGAMDAIIDVVGACIGFEMLGIERFVASKIHVGSGFVDMSHGRYPVPPPAVAELLSGKPIYSTELEGELMTPTGAAIITSFCEEFGSITDFVPEINGYGAGTREYDGFPNVLRLMLGQTSGVAAVETENLSLLEANLDDCTGETLGYLMDESLERGALDCWFTPIQMKKNRPGSLVSILSRPSESDTLRELLYTETSTIGVRTQEIVRECLEREIESVETRYGRIDLKVAKYKGRIVNVKPEFDQIVKTARKNGVEVKIVAQSVAEVCAKYYEGVRIVESKAFSGSS